MTQTYYVAGRTNAIRTLERWQRAGAEATLSYSQQRRSFVITVSYEFRATTQAS